MAQLRQDAHKFVERDAEIIIVGPEDADAFTKYLYMTNLGDVFSKRGDAEMRGPHLYVLQRLGIFRNRLTRTAAGKVEEFAMSDKMKAEVDARLEFVGITAENPWGK